jgi:hypothetical protein
MESITSIDALCVEVTRRVTDRKIRVIGIDGLDGVGKTFIAEKIAEQLNAGLVSLDDYLQKERETYVAHINCAEIRAVMNDSIMPIVVEGVCLRAAAAHCGIPVDFYIYVRMINSSGRWNDEDICLCCELPEVLKASEREFGQLADQLLFSGNSDGNAGLRDELIDYHCQYSPVPKADLVFDAVEQTGRTSV